MPSKQKRTIARQNGAKAAGSKSPQGIQTSARNALRHGLTSQTLVLANECPAKFDQLLQVYIEKFQPRDGVEMNLVDEMVAARWRQQRGWVIQTAAFNLQMEKEEQQVTSEPARLALAFSAMANHEKLLDLILRYETSYSRMHDRAMKALYRLREEQNLRNDPKPQDLPNNPPPPPAAETPHTNPPASLLPHIPPAEPITAPVDTNSGVIHKVENSNRRPKIKT